MQYLVVLEMTKDQYQQHKHRTEKPRYNPWVGSFHLYMLWIPRKSKLKCCQGSFQKKQKKKGFEFMVYATCAAYSNLVNSGINSNPENQWVI